jgi:hypothetical protein
MTDQRSTNPSPLILEHTPFYGRGLSSRTVERLIKCGIDAAECLLFMENEEPRRIGKGSTREIKAYRDVSSKGPRTAQRMHRVIVVDQIKTALSDLAWATADVI